MNLIVWLCYINNSDVCIFWSHVFGMFKLTQADKDISEKPVYMYINCNVIGRSCIGSCNQL